MSEAKLEDPGPVLVEAKELKWTAGDVIVAKVGVACPMNEENIKERIRAAFDSTRYGWVEIVVLMVGGDQIELSVISTP